MSKLSIKGLVGFEGAPGAVISAVATDLIGRTIEECAALSATDQERERDEMEDGLLVALLSSKGQRSGVSPELDNPAQRERGVAFVTKLKETVNKLFDEFVAEEKRCAEIDPPAHHSRFGGLN